jgi:hypothetical protein
MGLNLLSSMGVQNKFFLLCQGPALVRIMLTPINNKEFHRITWILRKLITQADKESK